MVIETKSNENRNPPVGGKIEKTLWIHESFDCGHAQEIPIDSEKVECGGCGEIVNLNESTNDITPVRENTQ